MKENKCNLKQNVGEDISLLSVEKHIPHKQQSQSIYHTAFMPSWVFACLFIPNSMLCMYQSRGNVEHTKLLSWIFTGWRSVRKEKNTYLIKNRCFLIVCHAKCWNIQICRERLSESTLCYLPRRNECRQKINSTTVTRTWNRFQTNGSPSEQHTWQDHLISLTEYLWFLTNNDYRLQSPLEHHNWSLRSFCDLYIAHAVKLYSNNKDSSTRKNPLWTNWIISGGLQNDLTALPVVLLMSSVLINTALAFSYDLIDISLAPFYLWF